MRTRTLFDSSRSVLYAAALAALLSGCGSGEPATLADASRALTDGEVRDAVLANSDDDAKRYAMGVAQQTENANLPAWRTTDQPCVPVTDTLGPGTLEAVRSAHTTVAPRDASAFPTDLKLGTYDQDGARRAVERLSQAIGSCGPFDLTGPLSRHYRATVSKLPGGAGAAEETRFAVDAKPVDSGYPLIRLEVYVVRTGSLVTTAVVQNPLSRRSMPMAAPGMTTDQVQKVLDLQKTKLTRPFER
ncbi:hypothetical protein [Streptomyces sp. NPDC051561]|uniref:hypothetical protein n=1 Tax=Streptomyces sp. NPDC051561 TaxID=3365658 RepID=UPI0037A4F11A